MLKFKVRDKKKFKIISEIDLGMVSKSIYNGSFDGSAVIQLNSGKTIRACGQHGVHDWEEEFGFIVVEN